MNWGYFKKGFLEKFSEEKIQVILLKELSFLKMGNEEKVEEFNQCFITILNKFSTDVLLHDSITFDYYTTTLQSNIVMLVKLVNKGTLT